MDFTIGEEERALEETAARVARDLLAPRAAAHDEAASFVGENLAELAKLGFLGLNLREEEGGAGASSLGISLVVERVAGACAATTSAMTAHYLATDAIAIAGTDAQKAQWLPAAAEGRALGAFALSEPQAGSNPTDMTTRGEAVEGGWRLTGTKQWITNGGFADFLVVFARTDPAAGARGLSAFLVGRDAPGFRKGTAERTMGLKGAPVFELGFDCRLPADALLGPAGGGFKTAMAVLDRGRVEIASMALGIAGAAFDAARDWAKQRQVGGRPIADLQGLQWMLADMHAELEAARLLTWRAALARDSGQRFAREAAVAKLYASEMAGRVTDAALQIHGGYGYSRALPLERYARDARILRIFEGSSEIQRNIIAREILR
jgi:alkylation response protein AidB-like acyl-CoA dehydrogenase